MQKPLKFSFLLVPMRTLLYVTTCCLYGAGRNDFGKSISRAIERCGALKIETFWGSEMATSEKASAIWAQKSRLFYFA